MKFAFVNEQRQESQPNLIGKCQGCGNPMIARCGEIRVWHWAHRGRRHCDSWWENESQWHRDWKGQFPVEWQEIVHHAKDGERHIADVKTDAGWVIEFQHSYIKPEERRSREGFYPKLIWVVDGLRRKRDKAGFQRAWNHHYTHSQAEDSPGRVVYSDDGALLRDWVGGRAHVFFDLGDEQVLWWLAPNPKNEWAIVARISRAEFIEAHRPTMTKGASDFDSILEKLKGIWRAHVPSNRRTDWINPLI
jgi:competence protein CoiA